MTEKTLWLQIGVAPTGDAFVQLLIDDEIVSQLSPELAREFAIKMLEAAEASQTDAFLVDFYQKQAGFDLETASRMLIPLREYRAEQLGKSQGPTNPRDWVMPPPDKMPNYDNLRGNNSGGDDVTKRNPKS